VWWSLRDLIFHLNSFNYCQLFEAHLLPTASVCKMRLKVFSLEKFSNLLCSSMLLLTAWLTKYDCGKY
jgi:hypothetical protein